MAIINTWNMFGGKKPPNVLLELLNTRTMTVDFECFYGIETDRYGERSVWYDKAGNKIRNCENTDCWRVKNG